MCLVISCEVGGDQVPAALLMDPAVPPSCGILPILNQSLLIAPVESSPFAGSRLSRSKSDRSALYIADRLASGLNAPLVKNPFSAQLIDVGRSLHHRELFGPLTRRWSADQRQILLDEVYFPHRERLRRAIAGVMLRHSFVIHLSVRTFASRSGTKVRRADVGLLYDPSNQDELDLCLDWIDEIYDETELLRVRRNYPRRGTHDSITKSMRAEFAGTPYLGIEVLANRAWADRPVGLRDDATDVLMGALRAITDQVQSNAA
ncbi:N-formylglutamate amidohydrolase [Rubripirellula lacrimiformis]|uniref:N-formylglutamate amidohydrolase n=1 Tax=Rubripirellula lacrimiformis TaxID=1930273 RepID=A0A517NFJ5_9BACT|nr:N-formylglutamate amidohydrolase [Rubripirellula lacrimiformis]QDT05893.1 N-formylglutamate amidohydrolase [Rubripirellula lacrimiformis]